MRLFLDVGAHVGETVPAALHPRYAFDRVVCFEPVPSCCDAIERGYRRAVRSGRLEVVRAGLSDRDGYLTVYGAGDLGASVYADAEPIAGRGGQVCRFRRASDWFRDNIAPGDVVYLKLNCEGAEVDIVGDLLVSGEFRKVTQAMIDFDARKVPSQRHRVAEITAALEGAGVADRVRTAEEAMIGPTHEARVNHWLRSSGAPVPAGPALLIRSRLYDFSRVRPRDVRRAARASARAALLAVLPDTAVERLRTRRRASAYR